MFLRIFHPAEVQTDPPHVTGRNTDDHAIWSPIVDVCIDHQHQQHIHAVGDSPPTAAGRPPTVPPSGWIHPSYTPLDALTIPAHRLCGTSWNQHWRQQQESLFKSLLRFSLSIHRSLVPRLASYNFVPQQCSKNLQYGGRTIYKDPSLQWCVQVHDTAPKKVSDNYNCRTEINFGIIN